MGTRNVSFVNNTTLNFGAAYYNGSEVQGDIIPTKIVGIKIIPVTNISNRNNYVLLWGNLNTTQTLTETTIQTTDLSQYKGFVVYYNRAIDDTTLYTNTIETPITTITEVSLPLNAFWDYYAYTRTITFSYNANEITIKNGYTQTGFGTGATDNDKLIITKIIGIK